jgi:hypothetical protein
MNARIVTLVVCVACKSTPLVTISTPEPSAHEQQPLACKSPHFDPAATCDTITASFYAEMANACGEAQPALAEALRAVARDVTLRTPPVGSEFWRTLDRKSFTLYQASWSLLPPECTTDFNAKNYSVDDYGRSISEVSHFWHDDPRCRPDEELFAARGDAQGTIDVGVWSFATVLAPHLTPQGKQYLRKLLVCEER